MKSSIIVATSENNVIGQSNALPWSMPEDMKYFKNTTWGMPVIMGRKTFESMNGQILKGRTNIVVTRKSIMNRNDVIVASNLNDALLAAAQTDCEEAFIIGGGELYKESINRMDRIYRTLIHTTLEGDTFFPVIDTTRWKLIRQRDCKADAKNKFDYSFQLWEKQ